MLDKIKRAGVAALLSFTALAAASANDESKFGRRKIGEYRLPEATLKKFASFRPSAPTPGESKLINTLLADTADWTGPKLRLSTDRNPYTIVVTLEGTALADGDAASLWLAGWRLESGDDAGATRQTPLAGLSRPGARAGETLRLTAAATPTSFKDDREVAVALGLVNARNLRLDGVSVQVWSGIPEATLGETLGAFRYAIAALGAFGIMWLWFRR